MAKSRRVATGVYERGAGHYAYVVTLPKGSDRKQEWVSGFSSADEAARARRKRLVELDEGVGTQPTVLSVGVYLERWLTGREYRAGNTWMNHERVVRLHITPVIGDIPLTRLAPDDLARMVRLMPLSCTPTARSVLGLALDYAVRYGHVSRNVARLIDWPAYHSPEMQFWVEEDARQFLTSIAGDAWELCFRLLLATGMRRGEVLALRWFDVDLKRGWLSVRATLAREQGTKRWFVQEWAKSEAGRRTFQLDATTLDLLRAAERRGEWVVANEHGQRRSCSSFDRQWRRLLTASGRPRIRAHDLRHTHVVLARLAGEPWERISHRIGHRSVAFTIARYGHITPSMLEASADLLGRVFG
jgi:integrase